MLLQIVISLYPAVATYALKVLFDCNISQYYLYFTYDRITIVLLVVLAAILIKQMAAVLVNYAVVNTRRNIEEACISNFSQLEPSFVRVEADNRFLTAINLESGMVAVLIPAIYRSLIQAPVTILTLLVVLILISPYMTFVIFVTAACVAATLLLFRKIIKKTNRSIYDKISDIHQRFAEWIEGYNTFVIYNASTFVKKRLSVIIQEIALLSKRLIKIDATQGIVTELLTFLAIAIFFLWIGYTDGHTLPFSNIIAFPAAIIFMRKEFMALSNGYIQLSKTDSAIKRLKEIIEHKKRNIAQQEETGYITSLELKNLSFTFKEESLPILNSISGRFECGGLNTIVGHSGCGKTTLFQLILKLLPPPEGTIFYNGIDIGAIHDESLHNKVVLIEQLPYLFEGTLGDNLFLGSPPDETKARQYLTDFGLKELYKEGVGLLLKLGTRERQLSAGERQRIAIIRALLKNPDLFLFDEVTSNIDQETSEIIINALRKLSRKKFVICITHDTSLIDVSDRLYELSNGKLSITR